MTNNEAIRKLEFSKKAYQILIDEKVDSGKLVGDGVRGEWKAETPLSEVYKSMIEAIDLAIKALEQQPCEDCISRKQAIIETYGYIRETGIDEAPIERVGTILRNLPSVTPELIKGRWIEAIDDTDSSGRKKNWHYKCSICGNEDSGWGEYNYCPICGAEMNGV